jgi:hypothetical protein
MLSHDNNNNNCRAFYGECASPDRFLAAVQSVVDACIDLDSQPILKEDPGTDLTNIKYFMIV